ncbi:hypothetical protein ACLKA7_013432 [Drosophila subpalustris]
MKVMDISLTLSYNGAARNQWELCSINSDSNQIPQRDDKTLERRREDDLLVSCAWQDLVFMTTILLATKHR